MERNKYKVDPEFDCEYQDQVTCPYCGHVDDDCYPDDSDECHEIDCSSCGETFDLVVNKSVSYSSTCMEGKHEYVTDNYHIDDMETCKRCGHVGFTRFKN